MSSTRKAKDDSVFHQNRYASSPEFERGLLANLVAKRCAVIEDRANRELIWFIQYLSHRDGGLAVVARELIAKFPDRIGTAAMMKIEGNKCSASEVVEIRRELPRVLRKKFPLRGETKAQIEEMFSGHPERLSAQARRARQLREASELFDKSARRLSMIEDGRQSELEAEEACQREEAKQHPPSYMLSEFRAVCLGAAKDGDGMEEEFVSLEEKLQTMCLNPAHDLRADGPWYFSELFNVLREYHREWIAQKSKVVVTALGKKVCDTLDYTLYSRSLSLMEGNARLGKSFSAKAWCEQHPGKARFVEVPAGNDETTFFRALARALGLGNFLQYKCVQIRERVESVLLTGDLLLVMDEAQRLWPQRNLRYGFPGRIVWVMTMANAGVPICMVSTPQFITIQKAVEKSGWNSAQLTGRIGHYESLPTELEESDLKAVAQAVLPGASEDVLKALAIYARTSARYLSAVDSIAKRAQYISLRAGRTVCTTADVRTAMKESVIPSDTILARTLEQTKGSATKRQARISPEPIEVAAAAIPRVVEPSQETEAPPFIRGRLGVAELIEG